MDIIKEISEYSLNNFIYSKRLYKSKYKTIDRISTCHDNSTFNLIKKTYFGLDEELPQTFAPSFEKTIITNKILALRQLYIHNYLIHPNINHLIKAQETKDEICLYFEDGGDCLMTRRSDRFYSIIMTKNTEMELYVYNEKSAKIIFLQLANAVRFIHSKRICHCDIKPSNIVIKNTHTTMFHRIIWNPQAKEWKIQNKFEDTNEQCDLLPMAQLIDFENFHDAKWGKAPCGGTTKAYLSPECIGESVSDGFNMDIWSLGCVLYIILTGMHPIYNHDYSLFSFYCDSVNNTFPSISFQFHSYISSELQSLIKAMLNPSPNKRLIIDDILSHSWLSLNK